MKHLLSILTLMAAVAGNGQVSLTDSAIVNGTQIAVYYHVPPKHPDTLKIIMLVSDTTKQTFFTKEGLAKRDTYAIYGYIVKKYNTTFALDYEVTYLDDRKRPLINKIVWMSKPLK